MGAHFTRGRSLVRSQPRPFSPARLRGFRMVTRSGVSVMSGNARPGHTSRHTSGFAQRARRFQFCFRSRSGRSGASRLGSAAVLLARDRFSKLPIVRQLAALPAMRRLYIGLAAIAALMFVLWLVRDQFLGSWAANWTPNLGTEAIAILVTVAVVDRIVRGHERARLKPRVDRALQDVGSAFRTMVRLVASDYKFTHAKTFKPLPKTSLGVLDHCLENVDQEDAKRLGMDTGEPVVLALAQNEATSLKRSRDDDRDVLEPDLIAQIDAFAESVRDAEQYWWGYPAEPDERGRDAVWQVVRATRDLGEALVRHDEQWLDEGEAFLTVPGSWGTEAAERRDSPYSD
jgi:hypothetical protein